MEVELGGGEDVLAVLAEVESNFLVHFQDYTAVFRLF